MRLKEYLSNIPQEEVTRRLLYLDRSVMDLHAHGYYVVCNMNDVEIIDDQITLASFKNKIDYINSGFNDNGPKQDILELCAIGICAYNKFNEFYSTLDFVRFLRDNMDKYVDNGLLPEIMREYYIDVLERGNYEYANVYYLKNYVDKVDNGRERGIQKTKSTAVGRALANYSEREAAYVNILLVPALATLMYLVSLVTYFIFFN